MPVRNITVYVLGDSAGLSRSLRSAAVDVDRFVTSTGKKGAVRIGGDSAGLSRTLRGAEADVNKFVSASQARGTSLVNVFSGIGSAASGGLAKAAVVGGLAFTVAFGAAVASAIKFEAEMRNVQSISLQSDASLRKTSDAVLTLSTQMPQSADVLAKGLYDIESSAFHGADAMLVLQQSAKAASAGLSDTDLAARAITGALNAYGLSAGSAKDVSDILFQTVNLGVVTFSDLAQNMGQFIGTAAQAKVPLQDVASAYAAITLSGIPAAEAATSVNQVLTRLLKPSKELAGELHNLGYESGASALRTDGLATVINKLRVATGGSADVIVRMFGDIRASRGVLALMAADGANYQKALAGIADQSNRTGATQRAFDTQMRSTSAQLSLLRNDLSAFGIRVGLDVLPPFVAFIQAARTAGADAVPYLEVALKRVAPVFQQLWAITTDLARILGGIAQDAAPFVKVLAEIAGAAVVGPLLLLLDALRAVTSFLARNKTAVEAVAIAYGATLLPSLTAVRVAMNRMILTPIVLFLNSVLTGAGGAAAGVKALAASIGLMGPVAAAAVAGFLVYQAGASKNDEIVRQAAAGNDELNKSFLNLNSRQAQSQIDELQATAKRGLDLGKQYTGFLGQLKAGVTLLPGASGDVDKIAQAGANAAAELAKLGPSFQNANEIGKETGLTWQQVLKTASLSGIDLSKPFEESGAAREQLIRYLKDLRDEDGKTARSIAQGADLDITKMEALEKAAKKVIDAATSAFNKDTDVLAQFDPAGDAKKVADAQAALAKVERSARDTTNSRSTSGARSALADEQRIARDRQSIADKEQLAGVSRSRTERSRLAQDQSITRARQKLADDQATIAARTGGRVGSTSTLTDAQDALAQAQAEAAKNTLESRYKDAIALSKSFIRDINAAIQRGLDPNVVAKLLEEGPSKAEPALQAILRDHSGRLVKMVNQSETAIASMSGYVAEQARIAAYAINAPTDYYTKNMKTAMAIAAQEAATGGKATVQALAQSLHLSIGAVRDIALKFGVSIVDSIQSAVDANPITVDLRAGTLSTRARRAAHPSAVYGSSIPRAEGGPITWGPFGRDAVPAMVTRSEYVQPVAAVHHYGLEFMDAVRTRSLPKFWDGGLVGRDGGMLSPTVNVAGPRVVAVPVPIGTRQSIDNSVTYQIGTVRADTPWDLPDAGPRTYSAARGVS